MMSFIKKHAKAIVLAMFIFVMSIITVGVYKKFKK